jgi:hypothetical protein
METPHSGDPLSDLASSSIRQRFSDAYFFVSSGTERPDEEIITTMIDQYPSFWRAYDRVEDEDKDSLLEVAGRRVSHEVSGIAGALRMLPSALYFAYPGDEEKAIHTYIGDSKTKNPSYSATQRIARFHEKMEHGYPSTLLPWRYVWVRGIVNLIQDYYKREGLAIADFGCSLNVGVSGIMKDEQFVREVTLTSKKSDMKKHDVTTLKSYILQKNTGRLEITGFDTQLPDETWVVASAYEKYRKTVRENIKTLLGNTIDSEIPKPAFQHVDLREPDFRNPNVQTGKLNGVFDVGISSVALLYAGDYHQRIQMFQNELSCIKPGGVLVLLDTKDVLNSKASSDDLLKQLSVSKQMQLSVIIKSPWTDGTDVSREFTYVRVIIGHFETTSAYTVDAAAKLYIEHDGVFEDLEACLDAAMLSNRHTEQHGNIMGMPEVLE